MIDRCPLGLGALLALMAGCAPMPYTYSVAPVQTPPEGHWRTVPCSIVTEAKRADCLAEHESFGLTSEEHVGATGYTQSPPDIDQVEDLPSDAAAIEAARTAVDKMLATTLKDPMSAIQYRTSAILSCRKILPTVLAAKVPDGCLCYEVNAKNSYGGYTGSQLGIAELIATGQGYVALSVPREMISIEGVKNCYSSHFDQRDASLIKAAVQ
jgi:hypothetical protein